ncbi:SusC/RagA family TonB-linked outer membrane protein [Proteiniphilum sp. UBA7639]|jgi:TonB-linked SusC/RagA family outer membrane protein|uniref:SusC/RagA family TonB-linked outer membrane protein n=1 Tax=Proteiniphilum sp. UBA7639 TaxID=1947289 RepID=UPI00257C8F4B|nr:TonB-dependent receptor [Proteiniphilum sp. UBA7639]
MRKIYRFLALLVGLFASITFLRAQEITVSGTVNDNEGETLPGVSVVVKGTTQGTVTDIDGNFRLTVPKGGTLMFSYVGFQTQEIIITESRQIRVVMQLSTVELEEFVAIAYGTQSRALVTQSISSVGEEEFLKTPGQNPLLQLQGKVAGLSLQMQNGQPGANPQVFIRGGSSTSPESDTPLFIIDGIVSQGFRNISDMNPSDIESVEVLKDAASTAIYGSRAANGIILITTKSGKGGKTKVNFKYTFGIEMQPERIPLLNAKDYIFLTRSNTAKFNKADLTYNGKEDQAKFLNGSYGMSTGNPRNSKNTLEFLDVYLANYGQQYVSNLLEREGWQTMQDPVTGRQLIFQDNDFQDATFTTGNKHEYDLDVSGGNDFASYYVGLRYMDQDGILRGTNYKNYSILYNGDYKLSDTWRMSTKANFQVRDSKGGGNTNNTISRSILTPPTYRQYYEDGTPAPGEGISSFRNRLHELYYKGKYDDVTVYRTTFQVGATWDILPGLIFSPSAYYFGTEGLENYFQAHNETTGNTIRPASADHNYDRHLQGDALLSYDTKFGENHNVSAVAGTSYTNDYSYRLSASGSGAMIDQIPTLNATADSTQRASSTKTYEATLSYFGRVNYDYKGKYMASASLRTDASSRFAEENMWGVFPGLSAGWNMHREEFFEPLMNIMSRWKWRASWGRTGNNNLSVADSRGAYTITGSNYMGSVGILNTRLKNSQLQWETTDSYDIGIDIGFFKNRLNFMFDYYNKLTHDRLYDEPLWYSTGFSSIKSNYGSIRNTGFEIELDATPIDIQGFIWNLAMTFSYNKGVVEQLPDNGEEKNRVGGNFIYDPVTGKEMKVGGIAEGERFGGRWAFNYLGTYQTEEDASKAPVDPNAQSRRKHAGDAIFEDVNGDGRLDVKDMVFMGYIRPDKTGGIINTFSYKGLTARVVMDWAVGHVIDNGFKGQIMGSSRNNNNAIKESMTNTWQSANDGTRYPKYTVQSDYDYQYRNNMRWDNQIGNSAQGATNNSLYYSKGDYLAFREISLSYQLPRSWVKSVKLSGIEIFVGAYNLGYITKYEGMFPEIYTGLDYGIYPRPRQFNTGARISF